MFREQLRAGESMSDIWDMLSVHESTLSSGYQNIRCPVRLGLFGDGIAIASSKSTGILTM